MALGLAQLPRVPYVRRVGGTPLRNYRIYLKNAFSVNPKTFIGAILVLPGRRAGSCSFLFYRSVSLQLQCSPSVRLSAWAYNARAWAYFKAGKAVQGLPDAEKSLELRPNDAETLDTRGSIFETLGRKEEAIADFRKALRINSNLESSKEGLKRLGVSPY
jgi:tetratricopeptide (TPR) repeat protein